MSSSGEAAPSPQPVASVPTLPPGVTSPGAEPGAGSPASPTEAPRAPTGRPIPTTHPERVSTSAKIADDTTAFAKEQQPPACEMTAAQIAAADIPQALAMPLPDRAAETLAPGPTSSAGVQEVRPSAAREAPITATAQSGKEMSAPTGGAVTPTQSGAPSVAPASTQTPVNATQAASPVASPSTPAPPSADRQAIPHAGATQAASHDGQPILQHASAPAQIAPALVSLATGRAGASQLTCDSIRRIWGWCR